MTRVAGSSDLVGGLGIGALVRHDEQTWRIVELEGMQAILLGVFTDRTRNVALAELVYSPGYRLMEPAERSGPLAAASEDDDDPRAWLAWDAIPRVAQLEAERLEPHILEMRDGCRSGQALLAAAGEPRPGYGPEASITDRVERKHRELKGSSLERGRSTLWAYLADYNRFGTIGLVDRRRCAVPWVIRSLDARYRRAIQDVLKDGVNDSKRDFWWIHRRVRGLLKARCGDGPPKIPKFPTFVEHVKLLDVEGVARNVRRKTIRGNQSRVPHAYRAVQASYVGELWELDATRTDLFTLDESAGGRWMRTWILGLIDVCSRTVRLRVLSHTPTALDAVLLLCDAMRPIPFSAGHLDRSRWHLMGVPEEILCYATEDDSPSDGKPILHAPFCPIDAVTTDRAWLTGSRLLRDACKKFKITLNVARKKKGSDKPHIERFFRTLRQSVLAKLPGYTGEELRNRGANPHLHAVYFRGELEHALERWLVGNYANDPIRDLRVPHIDHDVSPNTAWAESVTRTGFLRVPTHSRAWLELLPVIGVKIQHYGVEANGMPYDGPCLDAWRGMGCEYPGHVKGDWPLSYDPRDLRYLYFRDPLTSNWGRLTRRKARDPHEPFGQRSLLAAKQYVASNGGDDMDPAEVSAALDLLLDDLEHEARLVGDVRRALIEGAQRAESASGDHDGLRLPTKTKSKAATTTAPESAVLTDDDRDDVTPYDYT